MRRLTLLLAAVALVWGQAWGANPQSAIRAKSVVVPAPSADTGAYALQVGGWGQSHNAAASVLVAGWRNPGDASGWLISDDAITLPAEVAAQGNHYLTEVSVTTINAASGRVCVYRPAGATLTLVGSVPFTATNPAGGANQTIDLTAGGTTAGIGPVATGDKVALWLTKADTLNPSCGTGPSTQGTLKTLAGAWTTDPLTVASLTNQTYPMLLRACVKTACKRIEYAASPGSTYTVPAFQSPYYIILDDVVGVDGQTVTINLQGVRGVDSPGGTKSSIQTAQSLVLDLGATDRVTWAGRSNNLGAGEAAGRFCFMLHVDPAAKKCDLYYIDKTLGQAGGSDAGDTTLICHAVKATGARGSRDQIDATNNEWIDLTRVTVTASGGSLTIGRLVIARRPWVVGADSYVYTYPLQHVGAELANASLGYFAAPPYVIGLGIPGKGFSPDIYDGTKTPFWVRWGGHANSVIGRHDIREVRDATVCLVECGATNDLRTAYWGTDEAMASSVRREFSDLLSLVNQARAYNNEVVLTDVPPMASDGSDPAPYYNTKSRHLFNRLVLTLGAHSGVFVANIVPWIIDLGTLNSQREKHNSLTQDQVHFAQAGDRLIAWLIARAYQGTGDPWYVWPE
ncbi:MAG TPA: hypothetical protein VGN26_12475 [Armatimonadota bacterium]|jgi:hypothetical protein